MAATLVLDTITSSGAGITIDATKTFTVNGTLLTTGSTNILHKTGDYPIVTGDVAGKSELIITTTTATPRDITLPLVSVTGADTCIITVVASDNATGTNSVRVMNGGSEAWTGYQKGDFVKFCVSDGGWVVLDHKETYYSRFYLTADQSVASSASVQITGWTENEDIGNMWVSGSNEIVTPTSMTGFIDVSYMTAKNAQYAATNPALKLDGVYLAQWDQGGTNTDNNDNTGMCGGIYPVTSAQELEFWASNNDSNTAVNVAGGSKDQTHFTIKFTRTY
jgi:hypothetical protein